MKIDIEKALTDITNNFNETVKPSNHLTGPQKSNNQFTRGSRISNRALY